MSGPMRCKFCGQVFSTTALRLKMPVAAHFMDCEEAREYLEKVAAGVLVPVVNDQDTKPEEVSHVT